VSADAVFPVGWSYGGYLTLCALAFQPELWAGGIAGAPIADFAMQYEDARAALRGWTVMLFGGTPAEKPVLYRERSPLARADAIRAPLLIFAGKNDRRAPPRQVEAFVRTLSVAKKDVSVRWFDAGHGSLSADEQIGEMRDALAFLKRAVRKKAESQSSAAREESSSRVPSLRAKRSNPRVQTGSSGSDRHGLTASR